MNRKFLIPIEHLGDIKQESQHKKNHILKTNILKTKNNLKRIKFIYFELKLNILI